MAVATKVFEDSQNCFSIQFSTDLPVVKQVRGGDFSHLERGQAFLLAVVEDQGPPGFQLLRPGIAVRLKGEERGELERMEQGVPGGSSFGNFHLDLTWYCQGKIKPSLELIKMDLSLPRIR